MLLLQSFRADTRGLPRPDPRPERDIPSHQMLENILNVMCDV